MGSCRDLQQSPDTTVDVSRFVLLKGETSIYCWNAKGGAVA